jgi:hypothetical protein
VWDVSDLEAPFLTGSYVAATNSVDHNVHIVGDHAFEANYLSGLRVLRLGDLGSAELAEIAFFDTTPGLDGLRFEGAWGVYPFFESGIVLVSDIWNGLFVLAPHLDAVAECGDGIDGLRDFPEDPSCADATGASEAPRNNVAIAIQPRKPSRARKPVNPRSRGVIRIGVLGSAGFDVRTIDRATLHFGPGEAPTRLATARYRDTNGDGAPDLVSHYSLRDAALDPHAEESCLSWSTLNGASYRACDTVDSVAPPHH